MTEEAPKETEEMDEDPEDGDPEEEEDEDREPMKPGLFLFRAHNEIQRLRVACDVRVAHLKRREVEDQMTTTLAGKLHKVEKDLADLLEATIVTDPIAQRIWETWGQHVKGFGKYSLAKVMGVVDIEKADTVSALWKFAGFAPGFDRRVSGQKLAYCAALKVHMWKVGTSLMRAKGRYYAFYLTQKERLTERAKAQGKTIVKAQRGQKLTPDKETVGHLHGMALRQMIKLFISHLWEVWRTAANLPTRRPYVHEHLGHQSYYDPQAFTDFTQQNIFLPPKEVV